MKEKELLVDSAPHQLVLYAEKDDESYGPVVTGSFMSSKYLDDYFEKINKWERSLRTQWEKGEISPVYYYMILQEYGEKDLAKRAGVSLRRLRKHFKMKYFKKLRLHQLANYAEAFDIPVAFMFSLPLVNKENAHSIRVTHVETPNPYMIITKYHFEENKPKNE